MEYRLQWKIQVNTMKKLKAGSKNAEDKAGLRQNISELKHLHRYNRKPYIDYL